MSCPAKQAAKVLLALERQDSIQWWRQVLVPTILGGLSWPFFNYEIAMHLPYLEALSNGSGGGSVND